MVLKDDPEKKPGWGIFDFTRLFKGWALDITDRHDDITSEGSFAQEEACIPNDVVADNFREQLELRADKPRQGWRKLIARTAGFVVQKVQFLFYKVSDACKKIRRDS